MFLLSTFTLLLLWFFRRLPVLSNVNPVQFLAFSLVKSSLLITGRLVHCMPKCARILDKDLSKSQLLLKVNGECL